MPDSSLYILVKPKSAREAVLRTDEGVLVRVTAPPAEGAANTAVLKVLAHALSIPKSRLAITSGATGRLKRVHIEGISQDELDRKVAALPTDAK